MRRFVPVLAVALALAGIPPAVAGDARQDPPSAAQSVPLAGTLASLRAEHRAMDELVQVLKAESREGRIELTDTAKLAWQRGVQAFEDVESRISAGDAQAALLAAAPARATASLGAAEAFSVRASEPVRRAVKRYADVLEPRLQATREEIRRFGRADLDVRWWQARSRFGQAVDLAAVDRSGRAWDALVVTAGMLDQLVLEAAFGVRDQPTPP